MIKRAFNLLNTFVLQENLFSTFCVKDGSGALYCFIPKGKIIKAETNSLTLL